MSKVIRQRYPRVMSTRVATDRHGRLEPLDWLRGLGLILIVLSHGWALWWTERFSSIPPLLNVLQSGNIGVTVFLVVAGFLLTRSLIGATGARSDDHGVPGPIAVRHPIRAIVTRLVRISSQVYPLLAVVLVVAWLDPKETLTFTQSRDSALAVATYTWNWYLQERSIIARPDLGHLWYTAVYMQVTVLLVILIRSLRHRRLVLIAVIAGLVVACSLWRSHVVITEGAYLSLLRTTTRMDGMLWGALVALAWPWLRGLRSHGSTLAGWSLLTLAGLVLTVGNSMTYMGWLGIGANVAVAGFIIGASALRSGRLQRFLTFRPVVLLGRHSLSLYVWHYPIFFFVARHFGERPGLVKGAIASAVVITCAVLTTLFVEKPVARRSTRLLSRQRDAGPEPVFDVSAVVRDPDSRVSGRRD